MNFVRIGARRINLEQIAHIYAWGDDGSIDIHFAFNGEQNSLALQGNEALLLLAMVDGDDELVDQLYPLVNPKDEPVVVAPTAEPLQSDDDSPIIALC